MGHGLLRILLGIGIAAGLMLFGAVLEGVYLGMLVSPTCFMIVFGGAMGIWLMAYDFTDIKNAIRCIWTPRHRHVFYGISLWFRFLAIF